MTLSLEQKEELARLIRRKESQLRRRKVQFRSGDLWCRAIRIIINGGSFQTVLSTLEAFPQESIFVA